MLKRILLCFAVLMPALLFSQEDEKKGIASFYADKFEGRKTANGEPFTNNDFTAAHKELPFNSLVRVTNPANNKTIVVRINDRGPHIKGRIIDLTVAAAKKIGLDISGTTPVEIILTRVTLLTNEIDSAFQCNRFSDCMGNADSLVGSTIILWHTKNLQHMLYMANDLDDMQPAGNVVIERKGTNYFLLITGFKGRNEAAVALEKCKSQGFFLAKYYAEHHSKQSQNQKK